MSTSSAEAVWDGGTNGKGHFRAASGAFRADYSVPTRFEGKPGTNPEELIAAAHASCFAMAFSGAAAKAGGTPKSVDVTADVDFGPDNERGGFMITKIHLTVRADVEGLDEAAFQEVAEGAKAGCPVSKALAGVDISLDAALA